jgi:PIN domain nuclease of toxin-antitoxin system
MNVIIDTHIFLWLLNDPLKVKNNYLDILKNTNNDIFLSSINIAELMIKASIGKLKIDFDIENISQEMGLVMLPFDARDAIQLGKLPLHHKDPFDRMLITQAISKEYYLMSDDSKFNLYRDTRLKLL